MSIETELKKCAINLQQLTDAIVAQTAAMQVAGQATVGIVNPIPVVVNSTGELDGVTVEVTMGEELAAEHIADVPAIVTQVNMGAVIPTDKDIAVNLQNVTDRIVKQHEVETISGKTANVIIADDIETTVVALHKNDATPAMTMQQANAALQGINATLGDAGASIRDLFKKHNAITLGQLAPEKYGAFVEEARALTGTQA